MNSSPENESFQSFLERSFAILKQECPAAYRLMCMTLASRQMRLSVDDETITLLFGLDHILQLPEDESLPDVFLRTSRTGILELVDGKLTLQQAIPDGIVWLQGDLQDLTLFHEAWLAYMQGAVRCPSFPALLERYRYALIDR